MATIAVFIALGGGAYAITIPRNSVGTAQLKGNSVTTAKVKNGTLVAKDFRSSELSRLAGPTGLRGEAGAKGDPGPQGVKGDQGEPGDPGSDGSPDTGNQILTKLLGVDGSGSGLDADLFDGLDAAAFQRRGTTTSCPAGSRVTGIGPDGDVTCATDSTEPTGSAGGDLTGTYPDPTIKELPHAYLDAPTGTVSSGVPTPPTWTGSRFGGGFQNRTIPRTGWYRVTANWAWPPNTSGARALLISRGTAEPVAGVEQDAVSDPTQWTQQSISYSGYFTAGTVVVVQIYQTSGTSLGCVHAQRCNMSIDYMP